MEQQIQQPIQQEQPNSPSIRKSFVNPKLPLVIALVAVILAVGGILLLKTIQAPVVQTPSSVPSPQPQTLDTSGWQTYRNDEFGFEVRYPSDWKVTGLAISTQFAMNAYCQSVKKIDEQPPPDSGSAWVFHSSVQICAKAREDTLSLAEFMQQEYGDRLESWFETTEINGMLVYRSGGDRSADATLFLQSGNYRIQLTSAVVADNEHREERVSQVNQILSTFRFVK